MRVLVIGAGVIGSVVAAHLQQAGVDVTMLARGKRLEELRSKGLSVVEGVKGKVIQTEVQVVEHVTREQEYDMAFVCVRADQVTALLPTLQADVSAPAVVTMSNCLSMYDEILAALKERTIFGFPGLGGGKEDGTVHYALAPAIFQPTTFGEPDGTITPRLKSLVALFHQAGLPCTTERNMRAWLRTHLSWVIPFAGGIYAAGGSNYLLASQPKLIELMLRAIRECMRAMAASGISPTPGKFRLAELIPLPWQRAVMGSIIRRREIELLATLHCQSAPDEIRTLAAALAEWVEQQGLQAPCLEELFRLADMPVGSVD